MASSSIAIVFLVSLCVISTPATAHTKVVPDYCQCICEKPNRQKINSGLGANATITGKTRATTATDVTASTGATATTGTTVTAGATVTGNVRVSKQVVGNICKKAKYVNLCLSVVKSSGKSDTVTDANAVAKIAVSKTLTQASEFSVKFEKSLKFSKESAYVMSYKFICSKLELIQKKLENPGCRQGDVMADLNVVMSELKKCEIGFKSGVGVRASLGASIGVSIGASAGVSVRAQGSKVVSAAASMNVQLVYLTSNAISVCQSLPA